MGFIDFIDENSSLIFGSDKDENEENFINVYFWEIEEASDEFSYYIKHTEAILKDSHCAFGVFINCILGFVNIENVDVHTLFNKFEIWYSVNVDK